MSMPDQKPGRSKQDYGTPPAFLTAVRARLGIVEFDCDLAATVDNTVCPDYYDQDANALIQCWALGLGWNWLNPPFARLEPWVRKAYTESVTGARTAVLVPAGVGANWWRDWVHEKALVLFLNGRLTFVGETAPYPKDCALLLYQPKGRVGYEVWDWRKEPLGPPIDELCQRMLAK